MSRIWKVLTRKKAIDPVTAEETRLNRVLNVFDLTALGVGSTLGVGVYVLAGQVAKTTAGPSVVLSFLIAAIASVFAGLCYAEFGARAPRAGSAYIYSYVCVGEFIAFVIGWNLILEYVIGSASVARAVSLYLDTLLNNTLQDTFKEIAPIHVSFLASYFDFFSFGISILLAIALAFGLKESSMVNNIVTSLNILVVLFVIVAGSLKADPVNWHLSPNNTNVTNSTIIGDGGFFPFGVEGMIKGAATCFYGFVGFDCIATTGEEAKNPRKAIPMSIVVSLTITFLAYFGVATVLTLMVPYYLQDFNAPLPKAFEMVGWNFAKWIIVVGALFGLCASLFGAMFPLPRIIYAMGSDGLVFKFLAKVHPKFQTPVVGTLLAGLLTGLMSALFDLAQLVDMMSIGTLQAYTMVAASVLLLRYKEEFKKVYIPIKTSSDTESSESSIEEKYNDDRIRQNFDGPTTNDEQELLNNDSTSILTSLKYIINVSIKEPSRITENIVAVEVLLFCALSICIGLCAIHFNPYIAKGETWAIVITSVIVGLTILVLVSLMTQPKSKKELTFKVPFVPIIPALSILVNIYLMLMLDYKTWVRFAVWMTVGIPMYCMCACSQHSNNKPPNSSNYVANISNGRAKFSNGIPNPTFVYSEKNGPDMKQKLTSKKASLPPPTIFELEEPIEVQQEAAIAQLDEILDKETTIAQLDDVLNNEAKRINDRKLSAGTLSNMSAVASHSEDVIADVHCANIVTPVADPKSIPLSVVCDTPLNLDTDITNSESIETLERAILDEHLPESESGNNAESNFQKDEVILTIDKSGILTKNPNSTTTDILLGKVMNISEPLNDKTEAEGVSNSHSSKHNNTQDIPEKIMQESEGNSEVVVLPTESALQPYDEDEVSLHALHVPNEEALKSITLRHVKKQIKQFESTNNQSASDDNLKVGSIEYKNFIKDLDDKLKRSTVIPTFYVDPQKNVTVHPKSIIPNENVIEEPIDQINAKEKLKSFYATKNPSEKTVLPKTERRKPILDRSKSVDANFDTFEAKEDSSPTTIDTSKDVKLLSVTPNSLLDNPLEDHKKQMQNVFNSIKLKKLDTQSEGHLKRRLSKSLGSSFSKEDDKTDHKQKMDDIFSSIKAMRKNSFKEKDNKKIE